MKKIFVIIFIMSMICLNSLNGFALSQIYGDANGDGKITSTDCATIDRHILGKQRVPDDVFVYCDVNNSKTLNSTDIALIERYIFGMISKFPAEETPTDWRLFNPYTETTSITLIPVGDTYSAKVKFLLPKGYCRISNNGKLTSSIDSSDPSKIKSTNLISDVVVEMSPSSSISASVEEKSITFENITISDDNTIDLIVNNTKIKSINFPKPTWEKFTPLESETSLNIVTKSNTVSSSYQMRVDLNLQSGYYRASKTEPTIIHGDTPDFSVYTYSYMTYNFILEKNTCPYIESNNPVSYLYDLTYFGNPNTYFNFICNGSTIKTLTFSRPK